jgi:hypothetical protein
MLRSILCAACFFAAIPQATAQVQIFQRTQAIGKQRITDIVVVVETVPLPLQAGDKKDGEPKIVTMVAKDWKCGAQFKDGAGKVWRLLCGPTLQHNPLQLTGTLTGAADGRVLFLTNGGTLFLRIEQ